MFGDNLGVLAVNHHRRASCRGEIGESIFERILGNSCSKIHCLILVADEIGPSFYLFWCGAKASDTLLLHTKVSSLLPLSASLFTLRNLLAVFGLFIFLFQLFVHTSRKSEFPEICLNLDYR